MNPQALPAKPNPHHHETQPDTQNILRELRDWNNFSQTTQTSHYNNIPIFTNQFWTSKQRAAHSLHEISYRACFKPQLPRFFIERLSKPGEYVFDPFMGRGTTLLEASLLGRYALGNDANPLSKKLIEPRLSPPSLHDVSQRLNNINWNTPVKTPDGFDTFFEARTLRQICNLQKNLREKYRENNDDNIDRWIEMVALNRLTGHSKGFFSVYTLPPNQATSLSRQRKINAQLQQTPEYRPVPELILRKSKSLLRDITNHPPTKQNIQLFNQTTEQTFNWNNTKITLSVTSPPFMNIVNYRQDNWMRCWFAGINPDPVPITQTPKLTAWQQLISKTLDNTAKITRPGGWFAFEAGEIQKGKILLDQHIADIARYSSWTPICIMVNQQKFTKTSNTWGINNNQAGTNTNRIVLLQRKEQA